MDFRFNDNQILFAEATKEMLTTECTASRLRHGGSRNDERDKIGRAHV